MTEHTVQRAIIMAAGQGKRMQPVTLTTPKPLVTVNGVRMIDTVISALHANGVREICVVTGWLNERFSGLPEQYPGVTLIENPWYESCNNISSLYAAREYLGGCGCMILDGDQLVYDPSILEARFTRSGYNAVWTDAPTPEWLLEVRDGVVTGCSRTGGAGGWQLFSVSRWTKEDGARLRRHLEIEFEEKRNRQLFWDDIALFRYPNEYTLGIRPMEPGALIEIDDLRELAALDPLYAALVPPTTTDRRTET